MTWPIERVGSFSADLPVMQCVTVSVMPYAAYTSIPNIRSRSGMISPNTPTRNVWSAGLSGLPSAPITNGMTEVCVTPCSTTVGQKRVCDHLGMSTAVAPTPSTENRLQLCAFTWKNGRKMM